METCLVQICLSEPQVDLDRFLRLGSLWCFKNTKGEAFLGYNQKWVTRLMGSNKKVLSDATHMRTSFGPNDWKPFSRTRLRSSEYSLQLGVETKYLPCWGCHLQMSAVSQCAVLVILK